MYKSVNEPNTFNFHRMASIQQCTVVKIKDFHHTVQEICPICAK